MNIWMQAVFLATLAATFSLRNAGFTYSREENSYLTSDSPHLQDRQGLSSLHCAQLCAKNPSCKAANYDDSTSQCELLASKEGATAVQNGATLMRQFFIDDMIAFWPLNEQFGGKNLIDSSINFHLYDITFSSAAANDSWKSPPAYFAGRSTSYAHLVDSPLLALSESFSWMAAFYQDLNTNGPLFEMDLGPGVVGPLIWIHQDRFFFGVNYPTCPRADQQDSESVTNGQWYTYAVAYDHSNKMFSKWKNGVLEQKQQPACAENPTHEGTVSIAIGKRTNAPDSSPSGPRYLSGWVTCMSLYNRVMTYQDMHDNTMHLC